MADNEAASPAEIAKFAALAPRWWDATGPMRELHRMNPVRTAWIAGYIRTHLGEGPLPVLDFGCGGGIATESLARAGFAMTGVDAAAEAIGVARTHAERERLSIDYRLGTAAETVAQGCRFAAVTALEIIEHVPDQPAFMQSLAGLLRPQGLLFVSTLNRTWQSLAFAKVGAEYVVRLLPVGTHDWRSFVKPDELARSARTAGLTLIGLSGLRRNNLTGTWQVGSDTSVNYIAAFARTHDGESKS